jgi:hypothetical protein
MRVYLVIEYDRDDAEVTRGVFEFENIARQAVAAGLGTEVQPWDIEEFVPERVTVYAAVAHLDQGVVELPEAKVWPRDLPGYLLDELRTVTTGKRWICRSLDREKAVTAVTEALAARRRELGVPNA